MSLPQSYLPLQYFGGLQQIKSFEFKVTLLYEEM